MNKKGFTLIELIVTVAILAILSTVFVMSNLNAMEKQRKEADITAMEQVDSYLKEILLNDDVFNEIETNKDTILESTATGQPANTLVLNFKVTKEGDDSYLFISNQGDTISTLKTNGPLLLYQKCPVLYKYLVDYFDGSDSEPGKIKLTSANYKYGTYTVCIEFNTAQVSVNRPISISNDSVTITNTGAEHISRNK